MSMAVRYLPILFGAGSGASLEKFKQDFETSCKVFHSAGYKPYQYPNLNLLLFLLQQPDLRVPNQESLQNTIKQALSSPVDSVPLSEVDYGRGSHALAQQFMDGARGDKTVFFHKILATPRLQNEVNQTNNAALQQLVQQSLADSPQTSFLAPPPTADSFERTQATPQTAKTDPPNPLGSSTKPDGPSRGRRSLLEKLTFFENLETKIKEHIKGQNVALDEFLKWIEFSSIIPSRSFRARDQQGKPRLIALLAGPSGVGKTETIKQIAESFGDRKVIWIPGGEYNDKIKNNKIMGSGPGYYGNQDRTIADNIIEACEEAKQKGKEPPIILIDELDKANSGFFTIWNNVFDEGRLVRNGYSEHPSGREVPPKVVDFRGIDIFCTANFAQKEIREYLDEVNARPDKSLTDDDIRNMTTMIEKDADKSKQVRPDFWGRFHALLPFNSLSREAMAAIGKKKIQETKDYYSDAYGVKVEIPEEVLGKILDKGASPDKGCRFLDNAITSIVDGACRMPMRQLIKQRLDKETLGEPSNMTIALSIQNGKVVGDLLRE